jgi:hypothetical protein
MAFNQPATFDELWTDERVKGYLLCQPPAGENADFNALYNAYKHMRATDFERFLAFFLAEGRDIHALNSKWSEFINFGKKSSDIRCFC